VHIQRSTSASLSPKLAAEVRALCDAAYEADMGAYFRDIGPGEHLLGLENGVVVSHLMWVTRHLQPGELPPLRTAYVELVATAPEARGRRHATTLLQQFVSHVSDYQLAALSPATTSIYARLEWEPWRGPLYVRRGGEAIATPDEEVMILPLPLTPSLDLDLPLSVEWRPGEVW
jgi:aminoglycoside 2'-N-acetyltransferase I